MDYFTVATCYPPTTAIDTSKLKGPLIKEAFSCSMQVDKETCTNGGGTCEMLRDGFYIVNIICVIFGAVTFVMYIRPKVLHLQSLPLRAWRLVGGR